MIFRNSLVLKHYYILQSLYNVIFLIDLPYTAVHQPLLESLDLPIQPQDITPVCSPEGPLYNISYL